MLRFLLLSLTLPLMATMLSTTKANAADGVSVSINGKLSWLFPAGTTATAFCEAALQQLKSGATEDSFKSSLNYGQLVAIMGNDQLVKWSDSTKTMGAAGEPTVRPSGIFKTLQSFLNYANKVYPVTTDEEKDNIFKGHCTALLSDGFTKLGTASIVNGLNDEIKTWPMEICKPIVEAYWKEYKELRSDIVRVFNSKLDKQINEQALFTDPQLQDGPPKTIKDPCESVRNAFMANGVRLKVASEYEKTFDEILQLPDNQKAKVAIESMPSIRKSLLEWVKNDVTADGKAPNQPFSEKSAYAALLPYLNDQDSDTAVKDLCTNTKSREESLLFRMANDIAGQFTHSLGQSTTPSAPPPLPPPLLPPAELDKEAQGKLGKREEVGSVLPGAYGKADTKELERQDTVEAAKVVRSELYKRAAIGAGAAAAALPPTTSAPAVTLRGVGGPNPIPKPVQGERPAGTSVAKKVAGIEFDVKRGGAATVSPPRR